MAQNKADPRLCEGLTLEYNDGVLGASPPEILNEVDANKVKTNRFTWYSFLPLSLWEQFHYAANIYFLFCIIVHYCLQISNSSPLQSVTTVLGPFVIILILTAILDLVSDMSIRKQNKAQNQR